MEESGRFPGSMRLASPCMSPKALAVPGAAAKSAISLFSSMPVCGTAMCEPKLKFNV